MQPLSGSVGSVDSAPLRENKKTPKTGISWQAIHLGRRQAWLVSTLWGQQTDRFRG